MGPLRKGKLMSLKGIVLSDIHLGKDTNSAIKILEKTIRMTHQSHFDFLLLTGDMIDGDESDLSLLQQYLKRINVSTKMMISGNNDLESLNCPIERYQEHLAELLTKSDTLLLDENPVVLKGFGFAGTMGWWNGDLWKPSLNPSEEWPNGKKQIAKKAEQFFKKRYAKGSAMSTQDLFDSQVENLLVQLYGFIQQDLSGIVVASHYVPSSRFVLYNKNPKYDYLNWFMGFDLTQILNGFILPRSQDSMHWVCGHTHRSLTYLEQGIRFTNASGRTEPLVLEL